MDIIEIDKFLTKETCDYCINFLENNRAHWKSFNKRSKIQVKELLNVDISKKKQSSDWSNPNLSKEQIIKICDRNFIGCDQLILIKPDKEADAYLKFFNSDGGESGACGNGTRCVADLISKETDKKTVFLKTLTPPIS